jgi:polyhydroxyalkanoate synthesis regulator phasin
MSEDIFKFIMTIIIGLLIIWLIYRIKNRIKFIVKDEIYKNFPSIKNAIDNFEHRINYLKTQIEALERKISELENKIKK